MPYFKHPAAGDRTLKICRTLIEPKPNIPIRVGSGPPARYNDYRPRHSLTMAAHKNLRSNKCTAKFSYCISSPPGILHSGQICFFHLFPFSKEDSGTTLSAKLPAVCATQNHIKSYITSLCQRLGIVPWYTVSKYTIKSPIPTRFLSLSPQKVTQE